MKTQYWLLLVSCFIISISCTREERYAYEVIEAEVSPYLHQDLSKTFAISDTMIIYDTSFFNTTIRTLKQYENKLEPQDSLYNHQIIAQLNKFETEQIQTKNPSIYLATDALIANFNTKKDIDKIMNWLADCPKQFEAAKMQLEKTDIAQTEASIQTLKNAYNFISTDLKSHLTKTKQYQQHKMTIENAQFAVKDYLAFLNSKLLNEEVL